MELYLDLLKDAELWILVLELIIVPRLLVGPDYGLIRLLNWVKENGNLSGKTVLGIPVMTILAGIGSLIAALIGLLLDGTLRNVAPTPAAVVGVALAFLALNQAWYAIIESKVALRAALANRATS